MEMKINQLPAKTWRWLRMNEVSVESETEFSSPERIMVKKPESVSQSVGRTDFGQIATGMGEDFDKLLQTAGTKSLLFTTQKGRKESEILYLSFDYEDGDRSLSSVQFELQEESELTVIMDYKSNGSGNVGIQTKILAQKDAKINLIQVERLSPDFNCMNDIGAFCEDNASINVIQVILGGKNIWYGYQTDLSGVSSSMTAQIGYQVLDNNKLDMNYTALHKGKKTSSDMKISGVLKNQAKKLFRGTIDFKKGAAGAVGSENEDVLLLDDGVVNQTIPLILCAEEDVEGNHGATIGNLDDEQLFYLESRGISEKTAYELMAQAKLSAVCKKVPDEKIRRELEELLSSGTDPVEE